MEAAGLALPELDLARAAARSRPSRAGAGRRRRRTVPRPRARGRRAPRGRAAARSAARPRRRSASRAGGWRSTRRTPPRAAAPPRPGPAPGGRARASRGPAPRAACASSCLALADSRLVKKRKPSGPKPFSSTMRASGAPSASTVARVIASASGTSRSARSYQSRNCSIGSSASAERCSGGMSGRRGIAGASLMRPDSRPLARRTFYNERRGAISSVGQSASLIRRRSLVRVQDRPSVPGSVLRAARADSHTARLRARWSPGSPTVLRVSVAGLHAGSVRRDPLHRVERLLQPVAEVALAGDEVEDPVLELARAPCRTWRRRRCRPGPR